MRIQPPENALVRTSGKRPPDEARRDCRGGTCGLEVLTEADGGPGAGPSDQVTSLDGCATPPKKGSVSKHPLALARAKINALLGIA